MTLFQFLDHEEAKLKAFVVWYAKSQRENPRDFAPDRDMEEWEDELKEFDPELEKEEP